jgi:hypothetical protein
MRRAASAPIACTVVGVADREERARLWGQLKDAVTRVESRSNGFLLRVNASRTTLEAVGKIIALERDCCPFLRIQLDVAASRSDSRDTMTLSLTGDAGARDFLASALRDIGLSVPVDGKPNRFVALGISGFSFALLCCVLPPALLALGAGGLAHWFSALDSTASLIVGGSAGALIYGLYTGSHRKQRCADGC